MKPTKIDISYKTILFTFATIGAIALIWELKTVLIMFIVAFILSEALHPTITKLERLHIPRFFATLLIYVLVIAVFSLAIAGVVPIVISQFSSLSENLPYYLQTLKPLGINPTDLTSQFRLFEVIPGNLARFSLSIFSNLLSVVIVIVMSFYLIMGRKKLNKNTFSFLGSDWSEKVIEILDTLEKRLGSWIGGQFFLMLIVGTLCYIGYTLLGLEYSLALGILAGVLELVPNIGPTISTAIAVLVGISVSPILGLFALCWGIAVQQTENHYIVPKVMKQAVGLNPLVTILLLLSGGQLGGVLGAILAVPVYITIETILKIVLRDKLSHRELIEGAKRNS